MRPDRDPLPLLDPRADVPAAVRDALAAARGDLPSPAALARLVAKLPPLGPPGGSGAHLRPPKLAGAPAAAAPSILPGVVAGAALGLVVAGALSLWTPAPASLPAAPVSAVTPLTAPSAAAAQRTGDGSDPTRARAASEPRGEDAPAAPERPVVRLPPGGPSTSPADLPGAPPQPQPLSSVTTGLAADASGGTPTPPAESESALLQRAQQALAASPGAALALAAEHLTHYPGGRLAQEREVIAISALVAMGRAAEAEARASSFHAAYPRSAHGPRVEALVPSIKK